MTTERSPRGPAEDGAASTGGYSLLSCPCCENLARLREHLDLGIYGKRGWSAECTHCGLTSGKRDTAQAAVSVWNHRPGDTHRVPNDGKLADLFGIAPDLPAPEKL